jgi:hypothetical protein
MPHCRTRPLAMPRSAAHTATKCPLRCRTLSHCRTYTAALHALPHTRAPRTVINCRRMAHSALPHTAARTATHYRSHCRTLCRSIAYRCAHCCRLPHCRTLPHTAALPHTTAHTIVYLNPITKGRYKWTQYIDDTSGFSLLDIHLTTLHFDYFGMS